jgi:hypothetical protein
MQQRIRPEHERSILPRVRAACMALPTQFLKSAPRIARDFGSCGIDHHAHLFLPSQPAESFLSPISRSPDRPPQSRLSADGYSEAIARSPSIALGTVSADWRPSLDHPPIAPDTVSADWWPSLDHPRSLPAPLPPIGGRRSTNPDRSRHRIRRLVAFARSPLIAPGTVSAEWRPSLDHPRSLPAPFPPLAKGG